MKPTDFSVRVTRFLTVYLAGQRNVSPNTIKAYRDTFALLLRYCQDVRDLKPEKLRIEDIDVPLVEAFLKYLEKERGCAQRTLNHRLATLRSFFRYVQLEQPERLFQCQQILAMRQRRHSRAPVGYLSKERLKDVLAQPDLATPKGRRDAVMLTVLYDTGARVQELVDLSIEDVRLTSPAQVRLKGKGRRLRSVPLMQNTVRMLQQYFDENNLGQREQQEKPLFRNRFGDRMSRSGVRYILNKHVKGAKLSGYSKDRISPHSFRHSKGMHLLQSGISMEIIRDFLGHVDVKTTEIYARANLEMKRKALETLPENSSEIDITRASWNQNEKLLRWLQSL